MSARDEIEAALGEGLHEMSIRWARINAQLDAYRDEVLAAEALVTEAWPGELGHLRALITALTKAVEAENFEAVQRLLTVYQRNHGQPARTEAAR